MSIKIPISAELDDAALKKQIASINATIKTMGDAIAKANNQKFEPIELVDKADLDHFVKQSQKLLQIQGELRSRMQKSGQGDKNPIMANWSHMYLNESARLKRQQEMLVFLGASFEDGGAPTRPSGRTPPPPARPLPPSSQPKGPSPWAQQGMRVVNAGLNASGPVGGVVSSALGSGMSAGFGAGLAGLAGGMAALGVGKLIGAITDKISDAQTEAIMNDALMRRLGGGIGYLPIKEGLRGASNSLGITFNEGQQLAANLGKLGNLGGARAGELPAELLTAGGLARGFGADPAAGVSLLGTMRGLKLTQSDQDSKRVGLIIGETIAKSDAFAKADEVMEAIGNYATAQTRQSLGVLNMAGYSGQLSALAGSGIPGLDVAGSASLIARINSTLAAGGAKGEASQFFTSMVANRMGLDPVQAMILREGGAFATNDAMFGQGSVAARYGIRGPGGSSTFLQETLATLREKYRDPGMLASATANHLGIGINQAMALLSIKPNQMGGIQSRVGRLGVDMANLDATGIADLARIETADGSGLRKIADQYLGRSGKGALTADEARDLKAAMSGGDPEQLKDSLSKLAAAKGAIETEGSKTRDSIARLDNTLQEFADKSLPILNESRAALLFLAGKAGARGPQDLLNRAMQARHEENVSAIDQRYKAQIEEQQGLYEKAKHRGVGIPTQEEAALGPQGQLQAVTARQQAAQREMDAANAEISRLEAARAKELADEDARLKAERRDQQARLEAVKEQTPGRVPSSDHAAIEHIESRGRDYDRAGNVLTSSAGAKGRMQVLDSTAADPGYGVVPARNGSLEERARVGRDYYDALVREFGGDRAAAAAAYNAGPGKVKGLMSRYGANWLNHAPAETQRYVRDFNGLTAGAATTPRRTSPTMLPNNDASIYGSGSQSNRHSMTGEVSVNLSLSRDAQRLLQTPAPQTLQPVIASNWAKFQG